MEVSEISYRIIADLLKSRSGQQLTESRRWRIGTALAGIFRELGLDHVDQLVCLLAEKPDEQLSQRVVEALLNNETYFFRDRQIFEVIEQQVLPELAEKHADTKRLSIWSAGCSTGQEAFSLAMMFAEQAKRWSGWHIEILGTDLSSQAIATAQRATYTQFEIQRGLSIAQTLSHFGETPAGWQAGRSLQRMVRFKVGNILSPEEGFGRHNLVLCRNVLLYFDGRTRERAFDCLARSMAQDGYLMLGGGETTVGRTNAFAPVPGMQGLSRKTAANLGTPHTPSAAGPDLSAQPSHSAQRQAMGR